MGKFGERDSVIDEACTKCYRQKHQDIDKIGYRLKLWMKLIGGMA